MEFVRISQSIGRALLPRELQLTVVGVPPVGPAFPVDPLGIQAIPKRDETDDPRIFPRKINALHPAGGAGIAHTRVRATSSNTLSDEPSDLACATL